MSYAGFYINLDRSPGRRAVMEAEFQRYGLEGRYRRFSAADGNPAGFPVKKLFPGEIGCFTSHYQLLKENIGQSLPLHVLEDDVAFSRFATNAIQSIIADGRLDHYDIIYTDVHIPVSNVIFRKYKNIYEKSIGRDATGAISRLDLNVIDLRHIGFASTASMLIGPKAIPKLCALYEAELNRGAACPIDLFIREKTDAGVLNVATLFPFVTSVRLDQILETTLGDATMQRIALAGTLARKTFFVDCDWNECRDYIAKYLSHPAADTQAEILTHVLGCSLDSAFDRA